MLVHLMKYSSGFILCYVSVRGCEDSVCHVLFWHTLPSSVGESAAMTACIQLASQSCGTVEK